jgi:polyisoprenoid-binding protein YceI
MQTVEVIAKTKWEIDPAHSYVSFRVKHLMFSNVKGSFKEFEAEIFTTGDDFTTAEINLRIKAASIDTGNENRDKHLKSADFFDTEKFNEINFISNGFFELDKEGNHELLGILIMKGTKKQIKLNIEFGGIVTAWGQEKALFKINGKINRKDWGLSWNAALEAGGVVVGDEVWINCEMQLIRQSK